MAKKELRGIELELADTTSRLEKSMAAVAERIGRLKQFEHSGSVAPDELEAIRAAGDHLRRRRRNQDVAASTSNKETTRKTKACLERDLAESEALHKSLDECEAKFRMYNLPIRNDNDDESESESGESPEAYLERVSGFVRVTWQDPAAEQRRQGYKCLLEWLSEVGKDGRRRTTFEAMRAVLAELGTRISRHLIDYFLTAAAALERDELLERVGEVEAVIGRLSVEEGSPVIGGFVSVVRFFERTIKTAKKIESGGSGGVSMKMKKKKSEERERRVLHMIVIEVMRLEVSFGSPDLPMMVLDEVFLMMGKHLVDNVFEDKLVRIGERIRALKMEMALGRGSGSIMTIFEQVLDLGVRQVWNEIDINANATKNCA